MMEHNITNGMVIAAAQSTQQIIYEFARAATLEGWWVWAVVIGCIASMLFFSAKFYRRDVTELPRPVRWTLLGLRLLAIVGLFFFFFDLQLSMSISIIHTNYFDLVWVESSYLQCTNLVYHA